MQVCRRFELSPEDEDMVCFLVAYHMDLSVAMRRDIFDPETIHALARRVGSQERLKMLALLTYADIGAVNPTALSPWKAENLWRVYFATANYLNHSVDDERVHVRLPRTSRWRASACWLRSLAAVSAIFWRDCRSAISACTPPTRSFSTSRWHRSSAPNSVQTDLKRLRGDFSLTVITQDRPALFATLAGVLAGWGMNILKADAFANDKGLVVDSFVFTDFYHTLEMNVQEWERFKKSFSDVLSGAVPLEKLARKRSGRGAKAPKVKIDTSLNFDQQSSSHSTIIEVVTQDRPGLLHRIAAVFAECGCNIEVALIDTEGEMAIDTFYLRMAGKKLTDEQCSQLKAALETELDS